MEFRAKSLLAVLLVVSLAGCSVITGGPLEFEASPATINDAAVEEAGYEEVDVKEQVIEREISRAGITQEVRVTNWQAMYERELDLGPAGEQRAAVVSVFTTPKVEFAGQGPFNPIADYSNKELVDLVQEQYSGMQNVEEESERQVSILGETTTVSTFTATATLEDGTQIDVLLHVTKVETDDDFVIAVGVHPEQLPNEQQRVDAMFQNIQHEG